jgi:tripartite-type tricarboxylate transporter receptor subunit TctC
MLKRNLFSHVLHAGLWLAAPAAIVHCVLLSQPAKAQQKYPSRNIEVIVAFTAGGGVDVIGRAIAASLGEQLGQNAVVVNREGAAGTIGFGQLAQATPDGHVLGFGPTTPIANAPHLVPGIRYTPESFEYICQVFENVFTIAVGPTSKFKTANDLFAAAREKPLVFGHAGLGSLPHLSVENLAEALQLKVQHLPYRGDGAMLPVLLKGDMDFAAPAISSISGNPGIRPLVVFADKRHPAYPDVPTAKELGVAAPVPPGHNGLYAPKGLPPAVKEALDRACANAVKSEGVLKVINNLGQSIAYLDGAKFQAQTLADYKFKGELIKRLGLAKP